MPRPHLIVSQSESLIYIGDINSHSDLETIQIQIGWFFHNVFKGRVYPVQQVNIQIQIGWFFHNVFKGRVYSVQQVNINGLKSVTFYSSMAPNQL